MIYIDAIIPLLGGMYVLVSIDRIVKPTDPTPQSKKRLLKICAYGMILFSIAKIAMGIFS